jgi:hypothetical protein
VPVGGCHSVDLKRRSVGACSYFDGKDWPQQCQTSQIGTRARYGTIPRVPAAKRGLVEAGSRSLPDDRGPPKTAIVPTDVIGHSLGDDALFLTCCADSWGESEGIAAANGSVSRGAAEGLKV